MSYTDRLEKFNEMLSSTNDHVNAIRDAATNFNPDDPVGSGLSIATAASGGIGGIAGSVAGIQHYKDMKVMSKRAIQKLVNATRGRASTGNTGATRNPGNPSNDGNGAKAADNDGAAGRAQDPQPDPVRQDPVQDRIDNLSDNANPTGEANDINRAINAKADQLGADGRQTLNNAVRGAGRGNDLEAANTFDEGSPLKTALQKDFLSFKNKVANDAVDRAASGRTQASGYDSQGNPTGDQAGPQPQADANNPAAAGDQNVVQQAPDGSGAPDPAGGNDVNLAPDPNAPPVQPTGGSGGAGDVVNPAEGDVDDVGGVIQRGVAALKNLVGGQSVPGQAGQAVQGLRVNPDQAQGANMVSRLQQGAADQAQAAQSGQANPNGQAPRGADQPDPGTNGNINPSDAPPGNAGAAAADSEGAANQAGSTAAKIASGAAEEAGEEGAGMAAGEGIDMMAGLAGPAAPLVALVGGLVSLGTTIAGLFHHKPKPVTPPPSKVNTMNVGANLSSTLSTGAGVY
jgi:hypothetical protein